MMVTMTRMLAASAKVVKSSQILETHRGRKTDRQITPPTHTHTQLTSFSLHFIMKNVSVEKKIRTVFITQHLDVTFTILSYLFLGNI